MYLQPTLVFSLLLLFAAASCPDNCVDCDEATATCFACANHYELSVMGSCISDQNIENCALYGPLGLCFLCTPTYELQNGTCVKNYSGCILYDANLGQCLTCGFGTILSGEACSGAINCRVANESCLECEEGFLLVDGRCTDSTGKCLEKHSSGLCKTCKENYTLVGYECVSSNLTVFGCNIYKENMECLNCKTGFELHQGYCLLQWWIADIRSGTKTLKEVLDENNITQYSPLQENVNSTVANMAVVEQQNITQQIEPSSNSSNGVSMQPALQLNHSSYPNSTDESNSNQSENATSVVPDLAVMNLNRSQAQSIRDNQTAQSSNFSSSTPNQQDPSNQTTEPPQEIPASTSNLTNNSTLSNGSEDSDWPSGIIVISNISTQPLENPAQGPMPFQHLDDNKSTNHEEQIKFNTPLDIPNCAVADSVDKQRCKICNPPFTLTLTGCVLLDKFCQTYDLVTGLCQACQHNLILQNQTCLDLHCKNQTIGGCAQCVSYYSLNSDGYCYFNDPNCITSSVNRCMTCKSEYFVTVQGFCHILPPKCAAANMQSYACILCLTNFSLNSQGGCDMIAQIAIPNCASINGRGTCLQCMDGFYIANNSCLAVSPLCARYSQTNGSCFACIPGWSLIGATCRDLNCAFQNGDDCSICSPGFYLVKNLCTLIPATNCLTADSQGNCTKCQVSYILSRGSCILNPQHIQNCQSYNLITGACIYCFPGYSLSNNICTQPSPLANKTSSQNNSTGSREPNPSIVDPNCRVNSSGQCSECFYGYYYSRSYLKCIPLDPICKTSNTTDGTCLSCYIGYTLINKGCSVSISDPYCKKSSLSGVCLQCPASFYLSQGRCRQVSPLCKTYDPATGNCLTCYPGFAISGVNCQVSSSLTVIDSKCMSFNNSECTQCYNGFYLNPAKKCAQSNPLCKTINKSNGFCTSCFRGYTLNEGLCKISSNPTNSSDANCKSANQEGVCTACYQGYYLTANNSCSSVNTLCKTFTSSQTACTSCFDGYSLSNGDCIVSAQATSSSDSYCIKIENGVCSSCSGGYYLSKNLTCLLANPLCKTIDDSGSCTSCYQGYSISNISCTVTQTVIIHGCQVVNGTVCTACFSGYYLTHGSCSAVSVLCHNYNSTTGACIDCNYGFVFEDGACVNPSMGFDANCLVYSGSFCSQCAKGYRLESFICVAVDANCLSLDPSGTVCTSCAKNLTPSGLNCI